MFDYKHYIPVIRWKAAEQESLEGLSDENKNRITPVIELIMPTITQKRPDSTYKSSNELLQESVNKFKLTLPILIKRILTSWGKTPFFIDLSLVEPSIMAESFKRSLALVEELGLQAIPVISLKSSVEIVNQASEFIKRNNGTLCLRLYRSDLNGQELPKEINHTLKALSLSAEDVNLLVDFQVTDDQCYRLKDLELKIPEILKWKTYVVISGSCPKDLTGYTVDIHYLDRNDWNKWLSQIGDKDLLRRPSFGDYTILHPIYQEPIPGSNPSASIKYTTATKLIVMRGQGLKSEKSSGYAQYPANAQLLTQLPEFLGKDFSSGDAYIFDKGQDVNTKETGTPRTWIRAGINHHLAFVANQISNLS